MKSILATLAAVSVFWTGSAVMAQFGGPPREDPESCYAAYARVFEARGARDVEDGMHDNVIISIRQGVRSDCYKGKVKVEKGVVKEMFIKFTDGGYDVFAPNLKSDQTAEIVNGISKTLITADERLINVLFINHIKPKKKEYERASLPNPDDL